MHDHDAAILITSFGLETAGLRQAGFFDLRAECLPRHVQTATEYFGDLVRYILSGHPIKHGETSACGSWLIRFDEDNHFLRAKEAFPEAGEAEYRDGIDRAIGYWECQRDLCIKHGAFFTPIGFLDYITGTADIFDPEARVEGFRYPFKSSDIAALCLLGPSYDGDYKTLKLHHAYHVMQARPDLISYFALSAGYCFSSDGSVWFDEDLAAGK